MADGRRGAALDLFRLAAVMLVVANHTSPLVSVSPLWDFWFTRVLARVAVPFFLMVSGYFLAKDQWRRTGVFLKKTCLPVQPVWDRCHHLRKWPQACWEISRAH